MSGLIKTSLMARPTKNTISKLKRGNNVMCKILKYFFFLKSHQKGAGHLRMAQIISVHICSSLNLFFFSLVSLFAKMHCSYLVPQQKIVH